MIKEAIIGLSIFVLIILGFTFYKSKESYSYNVASGCENAYDRNNGCVRKNLYPITPARGTFIWNDIRCCAGLAPYEKDGLSPYSRTGLCPGLIDCDFAERPIWYKNDIVYP